MNKHVAGFHWAVCDIAEEDYVEAALKAMEPLLVVARERKSIRA
jgi:hypothetical protein